MTHQPTDRRRLPNEGDAARYVYVERAACPTCGSTDLRAYKTRPREADGTLSRYTACQECGARFILVLSNPE